MKYVVVFISIFLVSCNAVKDKGYVVENDQVIYRTWDTAVGLNETFVSADVSYFQTLNNVWAKDRANVYYRGGKISGLDASTFEALDTLFGKDANSVYCNQTKIVEANSSSFKIVNHGNSKSKGYGVDGQYIFSCSLSTLGYTAIESDSSLKFKVLGGGYSQDGDNLYWLMKKMNVNPNQFKLLGGHYALIDDSIYYGRYLMPSADKDSFQVLSPTEARDKNTRYLLDKRK